MYAIPLFACLVLSQFDIASWELKVDNSAKKHDAILDQGSEQKNDRVLHIIGVLQAAEDDLELAKKAKIIPLKKLEAMKEKEVTEGAKLGSDGDKKMYFASSRKTKEELISNCETKIENIKTNLETVKKMTAVIPRYRLRELKPGMIGQLESSLLDTRGFGDSISLEVIQVIDQESCLCKSGDDIYWIETGNTNNLTDGVRVKIDFIVEVKGTKQYRNALGTTKTVLHLKRYSLD